MEDIEYWNKKIESLQEKIHSYHFSEDIDMDKNSIYALLSDLKTAHSERKKILIREKKLQDTRSFWQKKWDFCKKSPSLAILIFMIWILIFMIIFFIGFCIYWFGFKVVIHKAGEFILGILGLCLILGFLGAWSDLVNAIRGK